MYGYPGMPTKIRVLSDLHTEFGRFTVPAVPADVVVLAGDIGVGVRGVSWASQSFPDSAIVYVAGNHEYYGGAIPRTTDKMRAQAEARGIYLLERDTIVVAGVRFVGTTLWTDFTLFGAEQRHLCCNFAQESMTDFRRIRRSPSFSKLRPMDTVKLCAGSQRWLTDTLANPHEGPTVVVTHHAPSVRSIPDRFVDDKLSAAYASPLDALVEASHAALWCHGHTHHCVDYRIGTTRVVSNQRGYPDELVPGFDPALLVQL